MQIDKASVLGEAANYIIQLQGRVKTLEEKMLEKDGEAIVSVDRSRPRFDEESSSSGDDNFADYNNEFIPEIEVRISETEVFLRIQSKKIPGMAVKMLGDIEKLHMTIISSSVMPFSNNSLLITVIAQVRAILLLSTIILYDIIYIIIQVVCACLSTQTLHKYTVCRYMIT